VVSVVAVLEIIVSTSTSPMPLRQTISSGFGDRIYDSFGTLQLLLARIPHWPRDIKSTKA
jgi:hypothetical protein